MSNFIVIISSPTKPIFHPKTKWDFWYLNFLAVKFSLKEIGKLCNERVWIRKRHLRLYWSHCKKEIYYYLIKVVYFFIYYRKIIFHEFFIRKHTVTFTSFFYGLLQ